MASSFSVALFWYFVISEVEMRKRGASMIRFRNRAAEIFAIIVLFASGVGAIRYAWTDGMLLAHIRGSKFEIVAGGLCLEPVS